MTDFIRGGPTRYHHQSAGLQKMIATGGVTALLFDPGLGKTATVIDYCGILALKLPSREARILVVCPLAAVDTWVIQTQEFISPQVHYWAEALGGSLIQRGEALAARGGNPFNHVEARRGSTDSLAHPRALHHRKAITWEARGSDQRRRPITASEGPDGLGDDKPRVVLEVVNIDTFTSRSPKGGGTMADYMVDAITRFKPDLVVVDESHKIKSASGNASRLLGRIGDRVPRRVTLTGTVMPHSPMDVFGQWRFLNPYAFGYTDADGTRRKATFGRFKAEYAITGGYMGHEITGFRNLDDMQKIMAENAIVARKADALDLPATTDVVVPVELSPAEKKAYAEMRDSLAAQLSGSGLGASATATNRLTQMLRLRQLTSGHLPDDNGMTRVLGRSKVNTIKSIVCDTLAGEKRVVVFCLFSREIDMLTTALAEPNTEIQVITGATPSDERMRMRKRFGSDDPQRMVMIAQIKTMSLAVNELVTASHAVYGSLSQQRDDLVQSRDRLNRIGQTKPVTFWYAVAPGTVDQVILDAHNQRGDLEAAMLTHVMEAAKAKGKETA